MTGNFHLREHSQHILSTLHEAGMVGAPGVATLRALVAAVAGRTHSEGSMAPDCRMLEASINEGRRGENHARGKCLLPTTQSGNVWKSNVEIANKEMKNIGSLKWTFSDPYRFISCLCFHHLHSF